MAETLIAPAPGPELKLGAPKNPLTEMPSDLLDAARAMAGEVADDPEPPKDTPRTPETSPAPAKAQEKASEKPVPAAKAPEPDKKEGPKELREALQRANAKADELSKSFDASSKEKADAFKKVSDLEARLAERDKKITEDYEPRVQRLDAAEKRVQQVEERLRVTNYMETQEFHDKYNVPIVEVESDIDRALAQSHATVNGEQVPATREHFQYILKAKTLNDRGERAEEIFGKHVGPYLASQCAKLMSLDDTRQKAAKEASTRAIDHEKRQQSAQAQAREMLRNKIAERESVHVADFKPADDDPDLTAAFNEGLDFANEVLMATPDSLGPDKFADTVAKARSKIIKAAVTDKKLSVANAKIAALEEQLAAYHKSDPDVETRRGGKPAGSSEDTVENELLAEAIKAATS